MIDTSPGLANFSVNDDDDDYDDDCDNDNDDMIMMITIDNTVTIWFYESFGLRFTPVRRDAPSRGTKYATVTKSMDCALLRGFSRRERIAAGGIRREERQSTARNWRRDL